MVQRHARHIIRWAWLIGILIGDVLAGSGTPLTGVILSITSDQQQTGCIRTISGRVTRADGTPAAGLQVSLGLPSLHYAQTNTDADGRYQLAQTIRPGDHGNYLLVVTGAGIAPVIKYAGPDTKDRIDFTVEPGHWIEGTVVDVNGQPVANAQLNYAFEIDDDLAIKWNGGIKSLLAGLAPEQVTDVNGHFRWNDLPAGSVLLGVYKRGYSQITHRRLATDMTQTITLLPTGVVAGQVVGQDGEPVTTFRVDICHAMSEQHEYDDFDPTSASTSEFHDAHGMFQLNGLIEVNQIVRLYVTAPGYFPASLEHYRLRMEGDPENVPVMITLTRLPVLTGTISDAVTGQMIPGAQVTVDKFTEHPSPPGRNPTVTTQTDMKGHFTIRDVPAKKVRVTITAPGYGRSVLNNVYCARPMKALLEKTATLSGNARIAPDDAPAHVHLKLLSGKTSDALDVPDAQIDPDGSFRFTDLPSGDYWIAVYTRASTAAEPVRARFVTINAGEQMVVDWDRPGAANLVGAIRGMPLAGMKTRIALAPLCGMGGYVVSPVGPDGGFHLAMPVAGTYLCTISQLDRNGACTSVYYGPVTLTPGTTHLDPACNCAVSGRAVYTDTGAPAAGIVLCVYRYHDGYRLHPGGTVTDVPLVKKPEWMIEDTSATTDANGCFALQHLPPGEWCVVNTKMACCSGPASDVFRLQQGEHLSNVALRIQPPGVAKFAVIDAETGQNLPDIKLMCWDEKHLPCLSAVLGNSINSASREIDDVPPGHYTVFPYGKDLRFYTVPGGYIQSSFEFDVHPGQTTQVTLALHKGGSLIFRLDPKADDCPPGQLAGNFHIVRLGSTQPVLERPDAEPFDGMFGLSTPEPDCEYPITLPPGKYDLSVGLLKDTFPYQLAWAKEQTIEITDTKNVVVLLGAAPSKQ